MRNVHRTYDAGAVPADIPATMRAIVQDRYGAPDVLTLREAAIPVPQAGEVLLRVAAASVNPFDWHFTTGEPYFMRLLFGLRRPRRAIRGADVVGRVIALGEGVKGLTIGARVAGLAAGSFAEYAVATASGVALVPDDVTDEEAAALPMAGTTALQAVRDHGGVTAGQKVLVVGASGGVGSLAVQLAASRGAEVTGVCSTGNVELVRSLGAAHVIDYVVEDWGDSSAHVGGYDVIIDTVGTQALSVCRRLLTPEGTYVMVGGPKANPWLDPLARLLAGRILFTPGTRRFRQFTASITTDDLLEVFAHARAGRMRPVISERIDLAASIGAIGAVGTGHTHGKVVVVIATTDS